MKVVQESDRLPVRVILGVGAGLFLLSVLFIAISALVFDCTNAQLGPRERHPRSRQPPAEMNAMEMSLFDSLSTVETRQKRDRERLEGYGWADREAGLVRIPLERAIDLYLQQQSKESR